MGLRFVRRVASKMSFRIDIHVLIKTRRFVSSHSLLANVVQFNLNYVNVEVFP